MNRENPGHQNTYIDLFSPAQVLVAMVTCGDITCFTHPITPAHPLHPPTRGCRVSARCLSDRPSQAVLPVIYAWQPSQAQVSL
jgi:hypothetical protein